MENTSIKNGNILIALFMGERLFTDEVQHGETFKVEKIFNYHLSWDAIMAVIEKIEKSNFSDYDFNFNITGDGVCISKYDDGSGVICSVQNEWGESKLNATWTCVVSAIDFIQNERQKQNKPLEN
jgi:hypothetical protein